MMSMPDMNVKPRNSNWTCRIAARRIFTVMIVLAAFSAIVIGAYLIFDRETSRRYDSGLSTLEAERIRDAAADNDNAEIWLAIHEEILWPRFIESIHTDWKHVPGLIWKYKSVTDALRQFRQNQYIVTVEHPEFFGRAVNPLVMSYKPRIVQAGVDRIAQSIRQSHSEPDPLAHVIGEGLNGSLRAVLEIQGRWGEAADQWWYSFLAGYSLESFEHYVRFQILGGYGQSYVNLLKESMKKLAKHPNDPWLTRNVGVLNWRVGKYAEAEPLLSLASDRFTEDPEGRFAWAESRIELGLPIDPDDIMGPSCRRSIHFGTQEAMRLLFRGRLYDRLGDFESARADAELSTKIDPRNRQAWSFLSIVSKKLGDTERSQFADDQAGKWEQAENGLKVELKPFNKRVWASKLKEPGRVNDQNGPIDPLIEIMRDFDWPRAATVLDSTGKYRTGVFSFPTMRKNPDLQPQIPDRLFLSRPVLRSEPSGPAGLGGVRL
jgi:tetratricopeptide (TPR) repeat protein